MKIKTIRQTIMSDFDDQVNKALEEGWQLTRRELLVGTGVPFYAELVFPDLPAEPEAPLVIQPSPTEAARIVKAECAKHSRCRDCALFTVCENESPVVWDFGPFSEA